MASLDNLPEVVRLLVEEVKRSKEDLRISEAYLTGSYARGDWLDDSDVDLIIVSEAFEGMEPGQRYAAVKRRLRVRVPLEVLAYTPEEFREAKSRSVVLGDMLEYALRLV